MMTIQELFEKTESAYSFNRYTESGWRGAIRVLRQHGMNDREVEAFLRSKHMRWAGDMDENRGYGYLNGTTVSEYIKRDPSAISQSKLDELVAGTF